VTASAPGAAGWLADPSAPRTLRYWDGTGWTPHTAAATDSPAATAATAATAETMEAALHLTARLPDAVDDDATLPLPAGATLPTAPTTPIAATAARRLALAGALTAAISLVVACAALGVALAS